MTDSNIPTGKDWDLALAKYGVIVPLVARILTPAEREAVRKQILAATHLFPGGQLKRIAPRTLREWVQFYKADNLHGLLPKPRKDKGVPRSIPPEVLEKAKALKTELPERSAETICNMLAASGGTPVARSTLNFHLKHLPKPAKGSAKAFRRFEHQRPNDCWQSDLSDGLWLQDPAEPGKTRKCYLHAFIDDHSRLVPHAQFYWRESLPALEDCFRQAIVKHGLPRMVYWDNGAVFRAQQLRKMAGRLGIEVVFSTPYAPEGRGKIERFFQTVKGAFYPEAKAAGLTTLEELNRFLAAWLERHYTERRHSETGMTPLARWEEGREGIRFPTPEELSDTFLWEEERVVRKTGDVSLCGNHYPVEAELVGQRVIIRFDPFDLSTVRVVHRGAVIATVAPAELVSRTFSKATPATPEQPKTLDSSKAFKDKLVGEHTGRQGEWGGAPRATPGMTAADFSDQVSGGLGGRVFEPEERREVEAFFARYAPIRPEVLSRALADAVLLKGLDRPVAYYLEAVKAAHRGGAA